MTNSSQYIIYIITSQYVVSHTNNADFHSERTKLEPETGK